MDPLPCVGEPVKPHTESIVDVSVECKLPRVTTFCKLLQCYRVITAEPLELTPWQRMGGLSQLYFALYSSGVGGDGDAKREPHDVVLILTNRGAATRKIALPRNEFLMFQLF